MHAGNKLKAVALIITLLLLLLLLPSGSMPAKGAGLMLYADRYVG
jgi:fumarate reductase subunit D